MKKRFLAFWVLMAVLCTAFPVFADESEQPITGTCGENLTWAYYKSTKTLTIDGTGNMSDYDESVVNGGRVAPWRRQINAKNIQNAVISDGVTKIADGAFENCQNLTSIKIPDGVKNIGNDAFSFCQGLTDVTIPDDVERIGSGAFYNCYFEKKDDEGVIISIGGLEEATIPNTVKSIGDNAFLDCKKLKKIYYDGSEDDWSAIEKGENYSIPDGIITYCAGINATLSDDGKSIAVKPINIAAGKTVILALYNDNKFVEMQSSVYNGEIITFIPNKDYTSAKVMVWASLDSMIPVCGGKALK